MSDFDFQDLFSRSLKRMSQAEPGYKTMEPDLEKIYYSFNLHGYRCDDFKDQEVLTLGCSQTLGHGLPLKKTWPFLLSEKTNMSYANLAKGGDSAQGQVIKAFQFFKEFHHPKYIFAVFPLTRMEMPYIKDVFAVTKNPVVLDKDKNKKYIQNIFLQNNKLEKFSKFPHAIDEVMPEQVGVFYNVMFIQMLEQYCQTNQIKFLWTFYNDTTDLITDQFSVDNTFLGHFVETGMKPECHMDFSKHHLFKNAADHSDEPGNTKLGHWGFHRHLHIAETIHSLL
jgi:hypothetical protein